MNEGQVESAKIITARLLGYKNKRHGHTCGPGETPEYSCWCDMKRRCSSTSTRKDSANYALRGITVCERWQKFENFFDDMGPKPSPAHSLERKDNNGNYCPENCRWATKKEQCRNTRRNHWITFEGKTMCLLDWANHLNIPRCALTMRLKRGWSVKDALTRPLR